jgi:hypothetical protein
VVGDEQIERGGFAGQLGQRLLAIVYDLDFVAVGFQRERNRKRDRALIFREKNVERRRGGSLQRTVVCNFHSVNGKYSAYGTPITAKSFGA